MRAPQLILALLLLGALAVPARAGLVVGNLTSNNDTADTITSPAVELAAPFTLDPSFTPVGLASINLRLATHSASAPIVGVSLWTGLFTPTFELADLGTAALTATSFTDFVFTPSSAFTLQPISNYWVVLDRISGDADVSWRGTLLGGHAIDPGSDPAANIPPHQGASSSDNGLLFDPTSFEHLFSVQSVPEPGSAALLSLGALIGIRHRRRCTPPRA